MRLALGQGYSGAALSGGKIDAIRLMAELVL